MAFWSQLSFIFNPVPSRSDTICLACVQVTALSLGDLVRKSIVFDQNTPKVFYCPQEKPRKLDKLVVKVSHHFLNVTAELGSDAKSLSNGEANELIV